MYLVTPYAPGSFLKPCIVVSTIANEKMKETALIFVTALNGGHALQKVFAGEDCSEVVVIQTHASREEAARFHVELVTPFCNGGSQEEWDLGWEPYLKLYENHCPAGFRRSDS